MFKKILIAEDFQGDNKSIVDTLKERMAITEIQEALYCDTAFSRVQVALNEGAPIELLITDLSFKPGTLPRKLTSGYELIKAARKVDPKLKIIVNSVEDNPVRIKKLVEEDQINGYVCKGRKSLNELVEAVYAVCNDEIFISPQIDWNTQHNVVELEELDLLVIKDMAEGFSKREIRDRLIKAGVKPNSESSLDKRVSKLFVQFDVKNSTHLIAKLTRQGII